MTHFRAFGVMARGGRFARVARPVRPPEGEVAGAGEVANTPRLHEEKAMEKAIPGEVFIPAKRVNFARCPHVGDLAGAVESSYGRSERADFEFPENKINIDKFPK